MSHAKTFKSFTPSVEEVLFYLKRWTENDIIVHNKRELDSLFLLANNPFSQEILEQKIALINKVYRTRIGNPETIIGVIQNHPELQGEIVKGNLGIVDSLKQEMAIRNIYSFLTKFFHHHNPIAYPFYSNSVANMLYRLDCRDHFYKKKVSRTYMASYENFYDLIKTFKEHYGLKDCSFLYLDILLNGSYHDF